MIAELPNDPDAPLWLLYLGDLACRLDGDVAGVSAYQAGLASLPVPARRPLPPGGVRRALRVLLAEDGPEAARADAISAWLGTVMPPGGGASVPAGTQPAHDGIGPPDPTLLLLWAEAATVLGARPGGQAAPDLLRQALRGLTQVPGPRAAHEVAAGLQLGDERLRALLHRVRGSVDDQTEASLPIWELAAAVDPLDPKPLGVLVAQDVEHEATSRLADRLGQVLDELDAAVPTDGAPRARTDALAGIVESLDTGVAALLEYATVGLHHARLIDLVQLAVEAHLVCGQQKGVTLLLDRIGKGPPTRGLDAAELAILADFALAHAGTLSPELRGALVRLYRLAADQLIERWPQSDEILLNLIVRGLDSISPGDATDVRGVWGFSRAERQAQSKGAASGAPEPEPAASLPGVCIVLAGGDAPSRRRAAEHLEQLSVEVRHIPPAYEQVLGEDQIRDRLTGADLVVEVWRQTKHQTSKAISAVVERLEDKPTHRYAAGTGCTSMLREVYSWATSRTATAGTGA